MKKREAAEKLEEKADEKGKDETVDTQAVRWRYGVYLQAKCWAGQAEV